MRKNFDLNFNGSKVFKQLQNSVKQSKSVMDGFRVWEIRHPVSTNLPAVPKVGPGRPVFEILDLDFDGDTEVGDFHYATAIIRNNIKTMKFKVELVLRGKIIQIQDMNPKIRTIGEGQTVTVQWQLKTVKAGKGQIGVSLTPILN